jgi:hypothetical protein
MNLNNRLESKLTPFKERDYNLKLKNRGMRFYVRIIFLLSGLIFPSSFSFADNTCIGKKYCVNEALNLKTDITKVKDEIYEKRVLINGVKVSVLFSVRKKDLTICQLIIRVPGENISEESLNKIYKEMIGKTYAIPDKSELKNFYNLSKKKGGPLLLLTKNERYDFYSERGCSNLF